jgi:hypothetical protein
MEGKMALIFEILEIFIISKVLEVFENCVENFLEK